MPGAGAELEQHALGLGERQDAVHGVADELIKQAEHRGSASTPTLNQTGELKAIFCLDEKGQPIVEDSRRPGLENPPSPSR